MGRIDAPEGRAAVSFLRRPYARGDEASINAGFNEAFGLARPIGEWAWKFGPGAEDAWVDVATGPDGAVAAQVAAQRVPVQVDGRTVLAGRVVDLFCRRGASRQEPALLRRLAADFRARHRAPGGAAFLYGLAGAPHLRLEAVRLAAPGSPPVPRRWRDAARGRSRWRRYAVHTWLEARAADAFWEACRARYPVAAVRDAAWLERRFLSPPGVRHHVLAARRWGRVAAWAVVRLGGGVAHLADLAWDGEDPRALHAVEEEACLAAEAAGARSIEAWLGGDQAARAALLERGWKAAPDPRPLLLATSVLDPTLDGEDLRRRFYVTLGDSDLA